METDVNEIAAKVAALLARSALEPGIREINELARLTAEARQVTQAYVDMSPVVVTIQASHSRLI